MHEPPVIPATCSPPIDWYNERLARHDREPHQMEVSLQIGRKGLIGQKTLWKHDDVVNVRLQSCPG
eukprot:3255010-Amphidinium_carterae.1